MSPIPTIAIVDDDQAMREALDDMIKSCGYTSRLFATAEEFLSDGMRQTTDCMLVDVKMPGMTGIELQAVLNTEPFRPPIIFITSHRDERTRSAAMDGGALAFLGKPVEFESLMALLERALHPDNSSLRI
ncbi:response regulator transcription factor [Labrys monachus]|uniref:FixJ family two-component response regulator n=1 Tax=Labrys monachus TaxID=217067 RepID=A0ABU0F8G1_9HYPH|nr:response regulator [Labrys monachus]MDQ0390897.1 FixJ family two-component response regulator [Labrys monachus]